MKTGAIVAAVIATMAAAVSAEAYADDVKAQIDNVLVTKSKKSNNYEITFSGITPDDIQGAYIDGINIDSYIRNGKASLDIFPTGFKMTLEQSLLPEGNTIYFATSEGTVAYNLDDALYRVAMPDVFVPANTSRAAKAVSNTVTIAGRISYMQYTNAWFGCSTKVAGNGAYVQAYRTLSPAVSTYKYANSSGDYTMTFDNKGGSSVLVTARLWGASNYTRKSVCSVGNCAYSVNLTIYECL